MSHSTIPLYTFRPGEIIFREGDMPDGIYIIRAGSVRISKHDVELAVLDKNAFFGEMALFDSTARTATATAIEATECMRISPEDFKKHLEKLEPIMQGIIRVLIDRLRAQNNKLTNMKEK